MRKVILLVGIMLAVTATFAYGQGNAEMQNVNEQSQEDKTFDEPLEKRVEKAVSGMEEYGKEVQKLPPLFEEEDERARRERKKHPT